MKVCLELQPCCGNRSGIGVYTFELAKRLHSTSEISFTGNLFNFLNKNDNSDVTNSVQFPVNSSSILPYGIYRRAWDFLPISYDSFFCSSDITHFFNYIVPPKIGGTVMTTIYDMSYKLYPETLDKRNLKRITKDINRSIERSDMIITISENSKKEILDEFKVNEERVKIVYPSFDSIASSTTFGDISQKFNIRGKYILYVGNLEPRKNIPALVNSFSKLIREVDESYQLVIAGQKGWLYDDIFNTIEKKNLSERVIFTGYVSADDKSALYKYASLFVYPSLYEGFGIPILEAMSNGVPVVCSSTSSMPEVTGEAALLVNPFNTDEITDGMYQLLTSEQLREEKIKLGYMQAKKFSWEASAEKLVKIYKELGKSI